MRFAGRAFKSGRYWAIVPILTVITQGRTKKQAFKMIADAIETLVHKPSFKVHLFPGKAAESQRTQSSVKFLRDSWRRRFTQNG